VTVSVRLSNSGWGLELLFQRIFGILARHGT
jgi:hypothetical protein